MAENQPYGRGLENRTVFTSNWTEELKRLVKDGPTDN